MSSTSDRWALVHLLAEPTRRTIYDAVRAGREPMTREQVAAAAGVSRRLAAFHLDLLADAGLLAIDYARPAGRTGPGAGRPAKRYAAVDVDVEVSIPVRRPDIAARILARAVDEAAPGGDVRQVAHRVATEEGERVGAARRTGRRLGVDGTLDAATGALDDLGYEPERRGRCVRLRNCPFESVVDVAPQLVCGVNQALVSGVLDGLAGHAAVSARLVDERQPPDCCVTLDAG